MDENPYRSPQTPGTDPERIPRRGYPYSLSATAYFFFSMLLAVAILGVSLRFADTGSGARLWVYDSIAGFGVLASVVCFTSGVFVLARSWRRPPS